MVAFDVAADRPEEIDLILNGLDRYNPDATTAFQEYVQFQCKNQTYDLFANLALLKLYVSSPQSEAEPGTELRPSCHSHRHHLYLLHSANRLAITATSSTPS